MLAAVFKKVAGAPEEWDPKAVEMGIISKIALMIKDDGDVYAVASDISAENGKVEPCT